MRFFNQHEEISVDQFSFLFPLESAILKNELDKDIDFDTSNGMLGLINTIGNPITIDAVRQLHCHRRYFVRHSIYREVFAKALGIQRGKPRPEVIDASGGMLGDSLLMLSWGIEPRIYERHAVVAALAVNALEKIGKTSLFHFADALAITEKSPVIYFDPMYNAINKKSAPNKAMQVFRELVKKDDDALDMVRYLQKKCQRLVIKRSLKAPPLINPVHIIFNGKSTRYDVYLQK